ncbi:hypothetical protein [Enterococcus sp. DIV0876]|uniref:hypothetical protein n=1 Tax=Enterococcus sp. DIV0876 TaxID=2774633 RepID=UPI003D2FE0FA
MKIFNFNFFETPIQKSDRISKNNLNKRTIKKEQRLYETPYVAPVSIYPSGSKDTFISDKS